MTYKHGVHVSEVPTSVVPPAQTTAGLPVVVGTAPIHLASSREYVNKPFLAYSYSEAVKNLGYSSNWKNYSLCEFMKSHFRLFNVSPVVFINVLDPERHKKDVTNVEINSDATKVFKVEQDGVLLDTLKVYLTAGGEELEQNVDYTVAFDSNGNVVISPVYGGKITSSQTSLFVSYTHLDPSMVTNMDIIGGVDAVTGKVTGLELINRVFPMFRLVPGLILAPGWSSDPVVAAVMKAKTYNINGLFKAMALTDLDCKENGADLYSEAPSWKDNNNYNDPNTLVFWPKVRLGEEVYHLSTQAAGVICRTDAENDDIPYVSPSNKNLQTNGILVDDGEEVILGPEQAAYLNGQGIVTALNFIGGWKLWGNRTSAYPSVTDVKDSFIPVRRMFNWITNTVILTYWKNVDNPTNRRLIDAVVDGLNIWLNGLTTRGALLGGRVAFHQEENPTTDLLNGIVRFHIYIAAPTPAEDIDFVVEFDVNYLNTLFE